MFGLRKVNGNTHSFETTFQNWKENGEDVALLMPEFSAKMATDSRRERQLVWMGVTSRVISLNFCRARWDGFNARNGKVNSGMAQFI